VNGVKKWRALSVLLALGLLAAAAAVQAAPAAGAAVRWRSVKARGARTVCLEVGGKRLRYAEATPDRPLRFTVRGPRRVKLLVRVADPARDRTRCKVRVALDGETVLTRTWRVGVNAAVHRCKGGKGRVTSLRRTVLTIPAGRHVLTVAGETAAPGRVLARLLRESRRPGPDFVALAPEEYVQVTHLQFDSGRTTTYYTFDAGRPLACRLRGPVELEVWTRLDFDHTLNGTQTYRVEALLDGEPLRTFHFQTRKLDTAVYVERPDVLPGQRKVLHLRIPPGEHRLELQCRSPEQCGVAARLRLPARELQR